MRRTALLAAVLLGLSAAPALATHAEPEPPVFVTQAVWFHDGGTKVGNLAAAGRDPGLTWDTRKPTTSATGGAGGGHVSDAASELALGDYGPSGPAFTGTFTGDLDNLSVDLYAVGPLATATNDKLSVRSRLVIDGVPVYAEATAVDVETAPGGQAAKIARFAYTNLYDAMKDNGLATGPTVKHTITLNTLVYFFATETVWLYDSSEVPSGMVFNTKDLSGRTVLDVAPPAAEE